MSGIHLELLDEHRRSVFAKLKTFREIGYLAGGTGLALQLNHRKSYDFDLFVDSEITSSLKQRAKKVFGNSQYLVDSSEQITLTTSEAIKITFLYYPYKRLAHGIATDSIRIASIDDIAADKARTIGRRATWRDYVDIYFILSSSTFTLQEIIEKAEKKFGGEFSNALFLGQLVYLEDLEFSKVEFVHKPVSAETIQEYLKAKVRKYTSNS